MRGVAFVLMALMLGACSGRDPLVYGADNKLSGSWTIEKTVDRVTGAPTASASVLAPRASNSGADNTMPAMMQLTCFDKKPIVRFSFEFKIGSDKNSVLGYRFDEKPGHDNVESRILIGYTVIVIEDPVEVTRFISELRTSKDLVVRIRSLNAGRTIADFKVDGSDAAIEAAHGACPVVMPPPVAEKKRRAKS